MKGFCIYVMRHDTNPPSQVVGIDTKFIDSFGDRHIDIGHNLSVFIHPYTEINKESKWKRFKRWLNIQEANLIMRWMTRRAVRGQSDIQTRTPAPVTDAEFHVLSQSTPELPPIKPESTENTSSVVAGFLAESTPLSASSEIGAPPDMFWPCKYCKTTTFLGVCEKCGTVTEF